MRQKCDEDKIKDHNRNNNNDRTESQHVKD